MQHPLPLLRAQDYQNTTTRHKKHQIGITSSCKLGSDFTTAQSYRTIVGSNHNVALACKNSIADFVRAIGAALRQVGRKSSHLCRTARHAAVGAWPNIPPVGESNQADRYRAQPATCYVNCRTASRSATHRHAHNRTS